jgi:hypothetical protein
VDFCLIPLERPTVVGPLRVLDHRGLESSLRLGKKSFSKSSHAESFCLELGKESDDVVFPFHPEHDFLFLGDLFRNILLPELESLDSTSLYLKSVEDFEIFIIFPYLASLNLLDRSTRS